VIPITQYARTDDGTHIAYSITGDGPIDVLLCTEWTFNLDLATEHPALTRLSQRLAQGSRVISMNRRGIGASDPVPVPEMATLESWVEDVAVVLDRVGSARAAVLGVGHGGHVAMVFAATRPERVSHLVLVDAYARAAVGPDYPFGYSEEALERYASLVERSWGKRTGGATFDPEVWSDPDFPQQLARLQRLTASPREAGSIQRVVNALDVRPVLELIGAPTLVIFLDNSPTGRDNARYVAESIAGARYVELPGYHYFTSVADSERLADEVLEFTTGEAPAPPQDRVLATVLFTDIVGSTEAVVGVGDRQWSSLLDRHDAAVRRQFQRFRGREVNTTGDGFLAVFDGPARAIRCAAAIHEAVRAIGLGVRTGLHCGEVELRGKEVAGVAVHLAQRICAHASPGEVLVSRTVVDLVAGSDLGFENRGEHELKGLSDRWQLWALRNPY
jgi:class 3 adenylate cyclase